MLPKNADTQGLQPADDVDPPPYSPPREPSRSTTSPKEKTETEQPENKAPASTAQAKPARATNERKSEEKEALPSKAQRQRKTPKRNRAEKEDDTQQDSVIWVTLRAEMRRQVADFLKTKTQTGGKQAAEDDHETRSSSSERAKRSSSSESSKTSTASTPLSSSRSSSISSISSGGGSGQDGPECYPLGTHPHGNECNPQRAVEPRLSKADRERKRAALLQAGDIEANPRPEHPTETARPQR